MVRNDPNDAAAARLFRDSVLFRAVRAFFERVDAAGRRSRLLPVLFQRPSRAQAGVLILVASLVHGALVTFVPATLAPLGRYGLATAGALCGALMIAIARMHRDPARSSSVSATDRALQNPGPRQPQR
jgi:hypothetical protein